MQNVYYRIYFILEGSKYFGKFRILRIEFSRNYLLFHKILPIAFLKTKAKNKCHFVLCYR